MRKLRNVLTLGILLVAVAQGDAQALPDNVGQASTGMPAILQNVTFRPELNAQMPLDTPFSDENGKSVTVGSYLHQQKPVLLAFVYYGCPMLCTQLEQGVVGGLRMLSFNPGRDYEVVFVSFDERDTAQMATAKKNTAIDHFRRPETASGWHFLTGSKESIAAVKLTLQVKNLVADPQPYYMKTLYQLFCREDLLILFHNHDEIEESHCY